MGFFFYRTGWQYTVALLLGLTLSVWLNLSNLAFAILLGLAGCVGLVAGQLMERWIAVVSLVVAGLLCWYAVATGLAKGVSVLDVLLIKTELNQISKPMTGVYFFVIGAIFIELVVRLEKDSLTRRSTGHGKQRRAD